MATTRWGAYDPAPMTRWKGTKIGRNAPCPCGSGAKFKRCHGVVDYRPARPSAREVAAVVEKHEAQELLRQHQQGKGRPIISAQIGGQRIVAVGNTVYFGKATHKTFVDFLPGYLATVLTPEWGQPELEKPREQQHQISRWYVDYCRYQQKHMTKPLGEVQSCPASGIMYAYLGLAYNLYLLDHNAELQAYLISRLKNPDTFYAAYYETYVASWFILAGFTLTIEDEQDSTQSHVEFVATKDGQSYSVEAKTRQPNKSNFDVGNQLYKALTKAAKHPRMVFIDMNVGADVDYDRLVAEATAAVRNREPKLTINGNPAPPAYVFVTNQPHHLELERAGYPRVLLCIGFKIPDFGNDAKFPSLIAAHRARQKHAAGFAVFDAFANYRIPITFDGELPAFAFGDAERRFVIGERYQIADGVFGTLTTATVAEPEKKVYLAFHTDDGKSSILTAELSDAELAAYKTHPQTFFGKIVRPPGRADTPMEMFDFFLYGYRNTPRERLLELLVNAPDLDELKQQSTEDVRLVYAERCTYRAMQLGKASKTQNPDDAGPKKAG